MSKLTTTKKLLLASLVAGLLAGCDGKDNDSSKAVQPPPKVVESMTEPKVVESVPSVTSTAPTSEEELTAQQAAKGNLWLDVFNNNSLINIKNPNGKVSAPVLLTNITKVPDLVEKYIEISENNGKFTLKKIRAKENTLDNFFTISVFSPLGKISNKEIEGFRAIAQKIKSMKPDMPELDKAGVEYVESIISMSNALNQLMDYYKTSEEFKLDDFKKSPELHKIITEAYEKYQAASESAKLAHSNLYEQLHAKELATLKARGFDTMVVIYESVDDVSAIFDGLVNDYNENQNLKKSDKAAYEAKSKLIDDALTALKKAQQEPATLAKEGLSENKLASYIEALNAYSIAIKVTLRDMGKNQDEDLLDDLQNKQLTVIERYNSIVQG